ncbi:MAG: hypothetical protein KJ060_11420 [Candidatus Hydrogenedentes bacterium]|nr:hypothetical protein [Candidatus Hydrogenedentota bacterium]
MNALPRVSGSACVAALTWAGFHLKWQQGRHMLMRKDEPSLQVVVPDVEEIDRAVLETILHRAGLSVDDFRELL